MDFHMHCQIYEKSQYLGHPSDLPFTYPLVHKNTENFAHDKELKVGPLALHPTQSPGGSAAPVPPSCYSKLEFKCE